MSNSLKQTGLLPETTAKMRIEAWQKASFESLLDRFHGKPKPVKYGRYQKPRYHAFVLGAEDAAQLIDPDNNDIARLRVYLALDETAEGKFTFIVQGRKATGNGEVYYKGCYQTVNSEDVLDQKGGHLPVDAQSTTIPFSLARLYVDSWRRCNNDDLVAVFHGAISETKVVDEGSSKVSYTIEVSERVAHYTYSAEDMKDLKDILRNKHLSVTHLIFFMGAGDPNPGYKHPFAFRPVMRVIFDGRSDTGPGIDPIIPPHVKFNKFDTGEGGSVTLEFATPCPPVCNND